MTSDHHLPQFHVRLPRGYLNDPNGPIDVDGRVHLYFQSRPRVDMSIPVEWAHATSDDLVHWTLHRPAIVPVPGGADSDGVWSGNTVLHDGEIRAYYSGKVTDSPYQSVLMAVSSDGGATFGAPLQVVADPGAEEGVTMFRDPFVWKTDDGWEMGVGAAEPDDTATIRRYRSADGVSWEFAGYLGSHGRFEDGASDTGDGWECPQVIPVGGTEVAIVGAWSHADGPGDVLAFPLDDDIALTRVDHGSNYYAASVMRESRWGPVLFGWVTEGRDFAWTEEAGWSGAISLPRRVWLDGGRLAAEPHPAVEELRLGAAEPAARAVLGAQAEIVVPEAATGVIRLRFSETEHLEIRIDQEEDTVTVDRTRSSGDARAHRDASVADDAFDATAARPALRILLDGSVVEVFSSAGRSITTRVYPTQAPPWTVEAPTGTLVWALESAVAPVRLPGSESAPARAVVR